MEGGGERGDRFLKFTYVLIYLLFFSCFWSNIKSRARLYSQVRR